MPPLQRWHQRPAAQQLAVEAAVLLLVGGAVAALPRIQQPESYHSFAGDHRQLFGIPHAPNVLSNLFIALPGMAGLWRLWQRRRRESRSGVPAAGSSSDSPTHLSAAERRCWAAAFLGMIAAAAGSAYYHLQPNHARLAWDRLGMGVTFAALLAAVVAERRSQAAGQAALPLLQLAVAGSTVYWRAVDDLRPYLLVQGGAAAGIAYLALAYPSRHAPSTTHPLLACLALYAAAVACDRLDRPVYWLTLSALSGHTLKHVLAGAAGLPLLRIVHPLQPLAAANKQE